MGGSKVSVPGPSKEERELQKQQSETLKLQREILEQQRQQQAVLLPFLAEQEGFKVETDEFGNITAISKVVTDLDLKKEQLEEAFVQRQLDALEGNLPVDPALERTLQQQESELRSRLSDQFGPGFETSTPGIETLGEFNRNAEILRAGARTGQLTLAEQLGITREQQNIFDRQSAQDTLFQSASGVPLTLAGAFGQNAAGFGKAQEPFIRQRQMQLQASIANAQSSNALLGAGVGLVGALFSDETLKVDLVPIGETPEGITVYSYTRVDTGQRHIGVLAQDVIEIKPSAVGQRGDYLVVDYSQIGRK